MLAQAIEAEVAEFLARMPRSATRPVGRAWQRWQKLRGAEMIAKVITRVKFRNGVEVQ